MLVTDTKAWYKQFWPWFLLAVLTLAIVACGVIIYMAMRNPMSLVNKDYYQEGLTINQSKAELHRAKKLGLQARIQIQDAQTMNLGLFAQEEFAVPSELVLQFNHPVDASKDQSFSFHKQNDDSFRAEPMTEAQWQLISNEKHWYIRLKAFVTRPSGEPLVDWILQGETQQYHLDTIVLDAGSG